MPIYRTTPLGREITDMVLAVNRSYDKSDYIPVVVWAETQDSVSRYKSVILLI